MIQFHVCMSNCSGATPRRSLTPALLISTSIVAVRGDARLDHRGHVGLDRDVAGDHGDLRRALVATRRGHLFQQIGEREVRISSAPAAAKAWANPSPNP